MVREMKAQGVGATDIAKALGIGRASVTGSWRRTGTLAKISP
jgi:hypothetical protein